MPAEKLITYVIDNGRIYSDHALYFVQAPEDFGQWLEQVLVPWLKSHDLTGKLMTIIGTCESIKWLRDRSPIAPGEFLDDVKDVDYSEHPPVHRLRYRGES